MRRLFTKNSAYKILPTKAFSFVIIIIFVLNAKKRPHVYTGISSSPHSNETKKYWQVQKQTEKHAREYILFGVSSSKADVSYIAVCVFS